MSNGKNTKINKTTIQWILSVLFILCGISSVSKGLYFIFFILFGVLINPKFPQLYFKLFKKNIGSVPRIIACVLSFLLIGVTSPKSDSSLTDSDSNAVSTTETTSTEATTTEATTITTTEKLTTTTVTTTTEEITVNPKYTVTEKVQSDNPLMNTDVKTAIIPKIDSNRGYIEISKEEFKNVTENNYIEFCYDVVNSFKGTYNYFTIVFEDGTGLCFSGCYIYDATYGKLDDTGAVDGHKLGYVDIDIETKAISSDTFTFIKSDNTSSVATVEDTIQTTTVLTTPATTTITTATTTVTTTEKQTKAPKVEVTPSAGTKYIVNTSTKKFHKPNCSSVEQIATENYLEFNGTKDELSAQGYEACGRCKP